MAVNGTPMLLRYVFIIHDLHWGVCI